MSAFGLNEVAKRFMEMKRDLPPIIGVEGRKFFVDSFQKQAWEGAAWQEVKRRIPGTDEFKYPKTKDLSRHGRDILIGKSGGTKSGSHIHLRSAVRDSLQASTWDEILYVVKGVPYAERHNEGLDGMPQRQFIGLSPTLIHDITARIEKEMKHVLHG